MFYNTATEAKVLFPIFVLVHFGLISKITVEMVAGPGIFF